MYLKKRMNSHRRVLSDSTMKKHVSQCNSMGLLSALNGYWTTTEFCGKIRMWMHRQYKGRHFGITNHLFNLNMR